MAQVMLAIGGRRYEFACRDGEEGHLQALARIVDEKAVAAGRGLGTTNETRQLLMASLLMADELADARRASAAPAVPAAPPAPTDATEGLAEALDMLAARLDHLATRLEDDAPTS